MHLTHLYVVCRHFIYSYAGSFKAMSPCWNFTLTRLIVLMILLFHYLQITWMISSSIASFVHC